MIVAVSDVHIGSIFAKKELFFKFLKALPDTTTLLLMGDIVDTWKNMPGDDFYKAFIKFPAIFYFPGNHDREILISQILSPTVQKERVIPVGKLQVLFTHGDIFDSTAGAESIFNRAVDSFFYWLSTLLKVDIRTKFGFMKADHVCILRPKFQFSKTEVREKMSSLLGKEYDFSFDFKNGDRLSCTEVIRVIFEGCDHKIPLSEIKFWFFSRQIVVPDTVYSANFDVIYDSTKRET